MANKDDKGRLARLVEGLPAMQARAVRGLSTVQARARRGLSAVQARAVGGLVAMLVGAVCLVASVPGQASAQGGGPPGNDGTVKIDGVAFDDHPDNEPHVG